MDNEFRKLIAVPLDEYRRYVALEERAEILKRSICDPKFPGISIKEIKIIFGWED